MRTIAGADCELSPKATTTSNPLVVSKDDQSSPHIDSGYREHYDRSMTRPITDNERSYLRDLNYRIEDALEKSYDTVTLIGDDRSPAADVANNAQTLLTLIAYATNNPEQEDLSPNFGQITKEALQHYMRRITFQEDRAFNQRLLAIALDVNLPEQFSVIVGRDPEHAPGRFYFQIRCWRMDVITKEMGFGFGGKAYLSPHQTDNELVQTIFGLYKGYWEHEARESFEYRERRVFGPHISTEALWSVARKVDVRSAKHVEDQR